MLNDASDNKYFGITHSLRYENELSIKELKFVSSCVVESLCLS